MLKEIPDERLRATVIWVPIRTVDNPKTAWERSREFPEKRITYVWDENLLAAKTWQKILGLSGIAWDVYLLYQPKAKWKRRPPKPDFWMHQLSSAEGKAPFLDKEKLQEETRKLLDQKK
ncbi:MAG: hypothetical protein L0196_08180 [candidate division Zixibacteria bacterium]|nr:hypothetical protein [candidate division Zixibacteria bacterium]